MQHFYFTCYLFFSLSLLPKVIYFLLAYNSKLSKLHYCNVMKMIKVIQVFYQQIVLTAEISRSFNRTRFYNFVSTKAKSWMKFMGPIFNWTSAILASSTSFRKFSHFIIIKTGIGAACRLLRTSRKKIFYNKLDPFLKRMVTWMRNGSLMIVIYTKTIIAINQWSVPDRRQVWFDDLEGFTVVCWDYKGVLYYKLVQPGPTQNFEVYCQQLDPLK